MLTAKSDDTNIMPSLSDLIRSRLYCKNPPSVVVFDGYTERTYVAAIPELRAFVETRYTRTLTVRTATRYPIEVYVLNE